jgi:hypothetical protein
MTSQGLMAVSPGQQFHPGMQPQGPQSPQPGQYQVAHGQMMDQVICS